MLIIFKHIHYVYTIVTAMRLMTDLVMLACYIESDIISIAVMESDEYHEMLMIIFIRIEF